MFLPKHVCIYLLARSIQKPPQGKRAHVVLRTAILMDTHDKCHGAKCVHAHTRPMHILMCVLPIFLSPNPLTHALHVHAPQRWEMTLKEGTVSATINACTHPCTRTHLYPPTPMCVCAVLSHRRLQRACFHCRVPAPRSLPCLPITIPLSPNTDTPLMHACIHTPMESSLTLHVHPCTRRDGGRRKANETTLQNQEISRGRACM